MDGTNFRLAQLEANLHGLDVPRFARTLARGYLLVKMRYYTSPLPDFRSESYQRQQRFFDLLRQSRSIDLVLGRHEPRFDAHGRRYHVEKETDVNLAVDMVVGAHRDRYDVAMLVAGDTDYVRAVRAAQEEGKRVVWCHFASQRHSHQLQQVCDDSILLTEKFLRPCLSGR